MKALFLLLGLITSSSTFAADLPQGQRLAETTSITSDGHFPKTKIEVIYIRACSERLVDVLTRSQLAAGKNYLEVGALVKETNKPCKMTDLPFVEEKAVFQLNSELPLVLLELDLSIDLKVPIKQSGATVGNF